MGGRRLRRRVHSARASAAQLRPVPYEWPRPLQSISPSTACSWMPAELLIRLPPPQDRFDGPHTVAPFVTRRCTALPPSHPRLGVPPNLRRTRVGSEKEDRSRDALGLGGSRWRKCGVLAGRNVYDHADR